MSANDGVEVLNNFEKSEQVYRVIQQEKHCLLGRLYRHEIWILLGRLSKTNNNFV